MRSNNHDYIFINFLKILGVILLLAALFLIQEALISIIFAVALAYLLRPLVSLIRRFEIGAYRPSLTAAVIWAYLLAGILIFLFIYYLFPPIIQEFNQLAKSFPHYLSDSQKIFSGFQRDYFAKIPRAWKLTAEQSLSHFYNYLIGFAEQGLQRIISGISNILNWLLIPILTFFLLNEQADIKNWLTALFPKNSRKTAEAAMHGISRVLTGFIKGQLLLCLIIGIAIAVVYSFMGIKYAILLGLIAGVCEAIPFIGPFVGYLPVLIVTLVASPSLFIQATVIYIALQAIENMILVPRIMGYYVELSPAAVLISMLVMTQIMGAAGLFFAVPIVASGKVILEIMQKNHWKLKSQSCR